MPYRATSAFVDLPLHVVFVPWQSARVEATSAFNGIGVVKLMGREAGFIAAHAALASGDVDLCLIPEVCGRLGGIAWTGGASGVSGL